MKRKTVALLLLVVFCTVSCSPNDKTEEPATTLQKATEHWPTDGWQYDTARYAPRFESLVDSFPGKYALLVVQNGKIAFEHYQEPYAKDSLIHVNSCTRTVISMLFGAVFGDQFAYHEHQPAIDYFPEYAIDNSLLQDIKVRHLLSMSSGLEWRGGIDATDVIQMSTTDDWANYVFERTVADPPGEKFHYNSGGSQVVATILDKQTKEGLMAFAKANLFHPLGISAFKWDATPQGVPKAGWGLHLHMPDMAKLGYLLLQNGQWDGVQIIPDAWVGTMADKHIGVNDAYDYGYQVWIPKNIGTECYLFRGSYPPSTKIIAVMPELHSVVVYVGENYNTNDLLRDFMVPALKQYIGNESYEGI